MDTESVKWFQIMNIFGSSLGTYSLCISLIILETKMLESWCNSLPGKQISEYLGQAAAERWSIWQPAKYALLQLPNKLRISFSYLDYSFFKKNLIDLFLCLRRAGPFVDGREVVNKVIFPLRRYTFIQPHIYILQPMKHEWNSRQKWSKLNGMVQCFCYVIYIFPQYPFHQGPALPALWRRDLRACAKALVPLHLLISAFFQRNVNRDQIWLLGTWHHQARSTVDSF